MPLLPKSNRSVQRLAEGGRLSLGYESQLGSALAKDGAAAAVGDALYQNLPPLAVPFIHVAKADLDGVRADILAQSKEKGEKTLDEVQKAIDAHLKGAKMAAAQRQDLSQRALAILDRAQKTLTQDPTAYNNPANRTALMSEVERELSPGRVASGVNGLVNSQQLREQFKGGREQYAAYTRDGRRLDISNKEALDAYETNVDAKHLGKLGIMNVKDTGNGTYDFGELNLAAPDGTEQDAVGEFKDMYLNVPTSTNGRSGEGVSVGKLGSLGQEHIITQGGGSTTTSNAAKLNRVAQRINAGPEGWKTIGLSQRAQYGLYEPKATAWENMPLQHELTLTDPQGNIKKIQPGEMTRKQALHLAMQAGDQHSYANLTRLREEQVGHQIANQLTTQLGLKVVNGTQTTQHISIGGRTDEPAAGDKAGWDKYADLAFGGPGMESDNNNEVMVMADGKPALMPLSTKNIGVDPAIMKDLQEYVTNHNVPQKDGKLADAPKTLADFGTGITVYGHGFSTLQSGAQQPVGADKIFISHPTGEIMFAPRNPESTTNYKQTMLDLNRNVAVVTQERKSIQQKVEQGSMSKKEGLARMSNLDMQQNTLTQRASQAGFKAFIKVNATASEETWQANQSLLGPRTVREGSKDVQRSLGDYMQSSMLRNSSDGEAKMRQNWGLSPANGDTFESSGIYGNEIGPGKNSYSMPVWLSADNLHVLGEKKNLKYKADLTQQERNQQQADVVGGASAPY